ncbi:MAG: carboxypeptidase-like regulatory domain-containing protein [bacterium]
MITSLKSLMTSSIPVIVFCSLFSGCHGSPGEFNLVVSGIVTDAETGNPVPGARVADHLYCGTTERPCQEAWTDENGRYELNTWYEEHSLVVSAPGYPPKLSVLLTKSFSQEPKIEMNFSISPKKL